MEKTDIFHLIETDSLDAADAALQEYPALLESRDRMGRTPLHQAVLLGRFEMAKALLAAGANPMSADRQKETVLYAAVAQDVEILALLLDAGAEPDQRSKLNDTALFNACDRSALEHARLLLAHGAQIDIENDFSQTPLHAAAAGRHTQLVELLLAAGAPVNHRDWLGNTPLHLSVSGSLTAADIPACLQTIDLLLAAGADRNAFTKGKLTLLRLAQMHVDLPELAAALAARGLQD